jgi:hypothetical protein
VAVASYVLVPAAAAALLIFFQADPYVAAGFLIAARVDNHCIETAVSLPHRSTAPGTRVLLRNASSFGILSVLGEVLSLHIIQKFTNHRFEAETRAQLVQALQAYPGAELTDLRFQPATHKVVVSAEIKALSPFGRDQVAALETRLPKLAEAEVELIVQTILTSKVNRKGYLYDPSEPRADVPAAQRR